MMVKGGMTGLQLATETSVLIVFFGLDGFTVYPRKIKVLSGDLYATMMVKG